MEQRRFLEATLGVYVATLLVPAAALAGWGSGAADVPAGVFVAAGVAIAAIVGLAVRTVDDLVDRLLSLLVVSALIWVPLVALVLFIFADLEFGTDIVAIGALVAMILSIFIILAASVIRARRLREQATGVVTVNLGETDGTEWKRLQIAGMAVGSVGMITAGAATIITGDVSFSSVIVPLGGLSAMVAVVGDNGGELVVTDSGLIVDQQFLQWNDLTGYRLTDETVEILTPKWYQSTRTFDREEMDDDETFIEGLAEFLPRIDERGRVERMARN